MQQFGRRSALTGTRSAPPMKLNDSIFWFTTDSEAVFLWRGGPYGFGEEGMLALVCLSESPYRVHLRPITQIYEFDHGTPHMFC